MLVYKNLSMAIEGRGPEGLSSTGVNVDEAPDGWFLKDAAGSRFTSSGYDFLWAMDVGDPAFRQRWSDNVAVELERHGWDGVFLDDVNPTLKYHHPEPATIRGYPNDGEYARATRGALAQIAPRLRAAGKLAVANNGAWVEYPRAGSAFLGHLDGAMDEMFTRYTGGEEGCAYRDESQWEAQLAEVQEAERRGKLFIGIAQACAGEPAEQQEAAARFGYATLLLGAGGRALFTSAIDDYNAELWYAGYDVGRRIGRPTGPPQRLSSGVWRRAFEGGLVVVNPQDSARGVVFEGAHRGWGLTGVAGGASLPGKSALVLEQAWR